MDEMSRFQQLLREWFETPTADTPQRDPRQTNGCLALNVLVRAAKGVPPLSGSQLRHVTSCHFCRGAYERAVRLRAEGFAVDADLHVPGHGPTITPGAGANPLPSHVDSSAKHDRSLRKATGSRLGATLAGMKDQERPEEVDAPATQKEL
jgi:hypothetical protein